MMSAKSAILLINTGSPEEPETKAVQEYLKDFLMDDRVMSMPKVFRTLLVKGLIVPFRAPRSAKKYQAVWLEEGAPLQVYTERLANKVQELSGVPALVAMRYNRGSVLRALATAEGMGVDEVVVVPLFPHYAMSSYESAVAHVLEVYQRGRFPFKLFSAAPYYREPLYIGALVEQIAATVPSGAHLLFSYHGIPVAQAKPYLKNPLQNYEEQCRATSVAVMSDPRIQALGLTWEQAYQSRLGTNRWLQPSTSGRIEQLAEEGLDRLAVVCPSFVCDGLETIEEIGMEGRASFLAKGGEELLLVPCPNDSDTMAHAVIEVASPLKVSHPELWVAPQKGARR